MTQEKRLTGKVPREAILMLDIPRFSREIIEGYNQLSDLTGPISDILDEMGIAGTVSASVLKPTIPNTRMIGPALTVRNIPKRLQPHKAAAEGITRGGNIEAHNLSQPGDVLVIEGVDGISNLGGVSATIGKRQGQIGAIVDGSVRDVEHCRKIGYPTWARSVCPMTGVWKIETDQVNGPVVVGGVRVSPGDLVVADDTGICFIPKEHVSAVLARAKEILAYEAKRHVDIAAGVPVPDLVIK